MGRTDLRRGTVLALLVLVGPAAGWAEDPPRRRAVPPGRHELSLWAAGHVWRYTVQVPRSYDGTRAVPLVVILHGAGSSGAAYLDRAGWAEAARREGFVAVAPDGLPARLRGEPNFLFNPRFWNSGQLAPGSPRASVDDLAFFRALLDDLTRRLNLDPARFYLTGHSNGGAMAFRLAAEWPEPWAAIAPVASVCWLKDPRPSRPVPTLYLVGLEDPLVPFAGGESTLPWGRRTTPPVRDALASWARALGCPVEPRTARRPDGVLALEYGPGPGGVALTALLIPGQGHGWPGGREVLPARMIGPSVPTVRATDTIWDFFRRHSRP